MGLTKASTGAGAADTGLVIERQCPGDRVIALAGNPNVGKSTVFNALTGMRQHTGCRYNGELGKTENWSVPVITIRSTALAQKARLRCFERAE